jgi:biotin carboxylase
MKLLILGANPETVPLIQVAKDMGIYTIATDFNPDAPAKKVSDKSYDIDGMDVKKLVELAKSEKVDGVLVGVADLLVPPYQKVCEQLKLPCYANSKAVLALSNKYNFKRVCESYGVQGVPEYSFYNAAFPVLVKPVDNCSGQGITICYKEEDLVVAIKEAKAMSRSGHAIVERHMTCDDVLLYYTFKDGECYLSATADRNTYPSKKGSPVNLGSTYPSKHTQLYLHNTHSKMKNVFSELEIKNGVLLIQAFVENKEFYVYDPGFRLQGEAPHLLLAAINGFDHRKMLINFALTGKMNDGDFPLQDDCFLKGKHAATLWILLGAGKIKNIQGMEVEDSRIVHIVQRLQIGDVVTGNMVGTEKQVFARFYLVCDAKKELEELSRDIRNRVKVFGESGESLVQAPL